MSTEMHPNLAKVKGKAFKKSVNQKGARAPEVVQAQVAHALRDPQREASGH